jgi:hypothetical protein
VIVEPIHRATGDGLPLGFTGVHREGSVKKSEEIMEILAADDLTPDPPKRPGPLR